MLTPNSAYGKSKFEAEEIQRAWQQKDTKRKLVIVRPAVIFGRGENGNFTKLAKVLKKSLFVYLRRKGFKVKGNLTGMKGMQGITSKTRQNQFWVKPESIKSLRFSSPLLTARTTG